MINCLLDDLHSSSDDFSSPNIALGTEDSLQSLSIEPQLLRREERRRAIRVGEGCFALLDERFAHENAAHRPDLLHHTQQRGVAFIRGVVGDESWEEEVRAEVLHQHAARQLIAG